MPDDQNICLIIRVLNPQKNVVGGTVDLEFQPQEPSGETQKQQGVDASKPIEISGLQRFPQVAVYMVTVTPTDVFIPTSQFLTIPASGSISRDFVIDKGSTTPEDGVLIVKLVDPNGNPLKGSVDITITNVATGTTFKNTIDYSQPVPFAGLQPQGQYQVTVKPASIPNSQSQTITLPAKGSATIVFTLPPPVSQAFVGKGYLVFDHGLPASGIVTRLYNVGFGGTDVKLGESKTDSQGNYSISYELPQGPSPNLQVRVLDSAGNEITVSNTKFNAQQSETLNLVVPASAHPLASEFQRLSADMDKSIGGVAKLATAQEGSSRQDLTLLNQSTNWDARVVALAATAAQQTTTTGMGHEALYGLFRVGLPTDPSMLAIVPSTAVQAALTKSNKAGIVSLNTDQIAAATTAFQNFVGKWHLATVTPGGVSNFTDLLGGHIANPNQQTAFVNLYLATPSAADFWTQAGKLQIPAGALDSLKLQGKFLHLTFNNATLAAKLQQDIGSIRQVSQMVAKDYDMSSTWQSTLTALAGEGGDQALDKLVPPIYPGKTTADRVAAYSADLARKVRVTFPTEVVSRMIERQQLPVQENVAGKVTAFLQAAAPLGYKLGRTPLNAFLQKPPKGVPELDSDSTHSLKTLHRLYQITPSSESLQAAMKLGFTSARDIASYSKQEFTNRFAYAFPQGEAQLVYGQAQTVSSVTFNFFSMAKQLDTAAPVYALSAPASDRQNAKNAIVQQFPTMQSLFGNLDFCDCPDCRSVLSPAAYFVDLLDFLRNSGSNPAGYTPLDVLVGKDATVAGRRPDLAALPLTCENTNTAMPYIDLVNEIFEYYVANTKLDPNAASDTGTATTADLTAEPQHILPAVYNGPLKQAVYPLNLPFDLWIETVRGFLNYFNMPLAQLLEVLRPADTLELFTDANNFPYYRAQILAESLGLSPVEYELLTVTDPATRTASVQKWFELYGYNDEPTALSELKFAATLAQSLGLTYQELTGLVTTGFLNPALYGLIFQFQRFGISMSDAFSYTGQPGYPALTPQAKSAFEALLNAIQTRYTQQNPASTFNAINWLKNLLPANYSKKVLVLNNPASGCDFSGTTLQYADGSAAAPLDYLRFNLFVRLWKKLGWTLDELDRALQLFFPGGLPAWSDANFAFAFSSAWNTALVYLAHLDDLNTHLSPALGRVALLPLWSNLPVTGQSPLYAQLFLTASALNNDWAFDDPNGQFPTPLSDLAPPPPQPTTLFAHQATVQGILGLTADEIAAILTDADPAVTTVTVLINGKNVTVPSFTLTNLSICYRYSALAKCLQLSVSDMIALKTMSGLKPFQPLSGASIGALADDVLYNQTLQFVKQVGTVQNSGFTVEDLKYLLRQQFDPIGKYQNDPNALIALLQTIAGGLSQIQSQNAVPQNLTSLSESLIDQALSGLFPAAILKNLFTLLTNAQTFTASQSSVLPANQIDPAPFAQEPEITFSYDSPTQTQSVTFKGQLLNWKKAQLKQINNTALFSGLLDQLQQVAQADLVQRVGDVLGVWASLAQYEAVQTGVANGLPSATLMQQDSALALTFDQSDGLQWLGYRGVLTDAKKSALTSIPLSPAMAVLLAALLNQIQQQTLPAYTQLIGSVLAMLVNVQSYVATKSTITPADAIDPSVFFNALAQAQQAGTIADPVPQLQFSYDPTGQVQSLVCIGVLTDSMRGNLSNLIPASVVLAGLLQDARNQAVQLFQTLATNLLTVTAADLDNFVQPFVGATVARQQKQVKAELVRAFLPLLARKLSRQLVLQTLSSNLASDPSLTEALVADAALLNDPSNPGKSLLGAFLAVGQPGVSAAYYSSADESGALQATGIAATTDTADPTNNKPGTASAHFEGYLQVPTDGPYRFFAELGDVGAAAALSIDSPDPTVLFNNPIISPNTKALKAGDEVSQFLQLKGGVAYHFTLDFFSLGTHGASLLIRGETLPKGPLSQVILLAEQSVIDFTRARTLLSKALQILQVTGLDLREVAYLVANAAQFNNLKLSALPTQPSDDSPANAVTLFGQFLTLADYADLRKGPAGGTDGLVDVFQAAAVSAPQEPNTPWTLLANLTRRDSQVVRDVATALGTASHFQNNSGIRRIWEVLQLVQIVGIPVASLAASTLIASLKPPASPPPDQIATSFKNAVKARYTADTWRPIAQSVFDKLRQKKRDALVGYLVNTLQLESSNQLFEYFLVDPGMEPVVQTSRLRLALSSVQTFIQRCLLNLENANAQPARNVSPSAIDADWWEWMKRYRVWQANREIFLFPENWMDPELRLDKTDLFQTLESTLLQGDVNSNLVEDALLTYLKGLDVRARLDIVATYLDQDLTNAGLSTLHVLGRTYSHPHKYFYRTYASGTWSAWQAVTPDIDGDHIALAIWRGRLNVFWVTFISQPQPPPQPPAGSGDQVVNLKFGDLAGDIFSAQSQAQYKMQLHWSEYFQGKWSNPIASDVNQSRAVGVTQGFDPTGVYIRITKEVADNGGEGAVNVHLDFPSATTADAEYFAAWEFWFLNALLNGIVGPVPLPNFVFRVTSKNCDPELASSFFDFAPPNPYNTSGVDATLLTGASNLSSSFQSNISGGTSTTDTEAILQTVNNFALLPCSNPVVPSPFLDPSEPFYQEAGSLVSPFFCKDTAHPSTNNELTFFVQPSLTEPTIVEWEGWAILPSTPTTNWSDAGFLNQIHLVAQVPVAGPVPVNPGDPVYSVFPMQKNIDWAASPGTALRYGNVFVGKNGGINVRTGAGTGVSASGASGSGVALAGSTFGASLSKLTARQLLTVVEKQGLSLSQLRTIQAAQAKTPAVNVSSLSQNRTS
jgi:hypothetical protein